MNKFITTCLQTCNKLPIFTPSFFLCEWLHYPTFSTITFSHEEFMFVLVHMLEMGLYADNVHMKNHDFFRNSLAVSLPAVWLRGGLRLEHNEGLTLWFSLFHSRNYLQLEQTINVKMLTYKIHWMVTESMISELKTGQVCKSYLL